MSSSNFKVKVINEEKGKGLFASRAFKDGDTILTEKPLVCCQFSWNLEYGYLACDNCLRPLETAEENVHRLTENSTIILPHPECCETKKELIVECPDCATKYCSIECQNEAYSRYHSTLCFRTREKDESHPLVQLNETWKQMHYPPESGTIMLPARMVAIVNQADNKEEVLSTFSQFCHCAVNEVHEIAHKLLEEKFIGQIDVLRETMQKALDTKLTSNWFTPDGFRSLLALIGTNGQGIGTSAFSVWVKNVSALDLPREERIFVDKLIDRIYSEMDEAVGVFLNNEGSGLYALQSAINHSCVPNAIVEFPFSNNVLVLKAIRNIQPEEEICISYLDECDQERSRHSRQKALRSLYLFVCRCDKCLSQAGDPDLTSEDEFDDDMSS
ncbi:SET and MYND domain containing, class 5 [Halictus rubicundus]|uniref:SET and MYND domain containing, class 5 n=1 Tax=Halictus rubicundus TaxID=77578 RepID=UPI0040374242